MSYGTTKIKSRSHVRFDCAKTYKLTMILFSTPTFSYSTPVALDNVCPSTVAFSTKVKKIMRIWKVFNKQRKKTHMSINHQWIMENHCNKKISLAKYSEKTDILLHIPRISQYAKNILLVYTVIYLHSHLNLFIFRIGQKVPQHTIDIYSN